MVKDLREAFNAAPEPYEITIAIPGNITKLELGYDLVGLAEHVDWFNIMACKYPNVLFCTNNHRSFSFISWAFDSFSILGQRRLVGILGPEENCNVAY
jgi:hypothetical protein